MMHPNDKSLGDFKEYDQYCKNYYTWWNELHVKECNDIIDKILLKDSQLKREVK